MNRIIFGVIVSLAVFSSVFCQNDSLAQCSSTNCPNGEVCCQDVVLGATCYDASIFSCPVGSQGTILCGFQEHGADFACGVVCYDNVDYVCCNNSVWNRNASNIPWGLGCTNNDNSGGSSTAAPSTQAPSTAAPSTQAPSTAAPSTLSPSVAPVFMCGNSACNTSLCCNDVRLGNTCYDDAVNTCLLGSQGHILCSVDAAFACGLTCYDNTTSVCCNNVVYNKSQSGIPCGSIIITTNETSSEIDGGDVTAQCGSVLCSTGEACCVSVQIGPTCYSTESNSCSNGEIGNVLCGIYEQVCNMTCYDPQNYFCGVNSTLIYSGSSSVAVSASHVFGAISFAVISWLLF